MPTPITANAQGVVTGKFHIPKNIKAGTKQVRFIGDQKGHAETTFTGQGTVVTNTQRVVHNIQQSYYDPLAQTFMLTSPRQLSGVDVWLATKGTTPLIVQLRETSVGFPSRTIIAEGRVDQGSLTTGTWVRVDFDTPFYASANIEYAVVVLANDAVTEIGISELGKPDLAQGGYVTQQPYQVGVLLSSANASTWTAHQDKDLTFRLIARKYDASKPKSLILGTITLDTDTTDLLVSALTSTPTTGADADLVLYEMSTEPGKENDLTEKKSERTVSDGQIVKFNIAQGGRYTVVANLRCTDYASATIAPGSQIIQGIKAGKGTYVCRNIPVADSKSANGWKLTVTLEQLGGGSVDVAWGWVPTQGAVTDAVFNANKMTGVTGTADANSGRTENIYTATIPSAGKTGNIKLRVTLTGQNAADRPQVFNLRASMVEA